jgi:hypothetical protein
MTDTQISVGMNVDGVVTGTEKAKRKIRELGGAAREAGKGTGAIGDGMAGSAQKVEAATKNMVGSIQRQIAALEAGDKSSRQYQESLARMRGIDTAALKPYLDQLDAVKAKQAAATVSQESFVSGFNAIRVGALAAAATIGSFGLAFKNIINGVDALNDLKDATGASIENISALEDVALRTGGSFDTVSTSLIKLNKGLADAKPGSDMAIAINAIGLSVEDLKKLDPAEAFRKTAVALSGFADDANKARLTQELFGKSLKEVAPFLKDLAEKGELVAKVTTEQADEAERFNKSLFEMQKNVTDISRGLAGPLVTALNEVIAKFKEGSAEGKGFMSIASDRYWSNIRKFYGMEQPVVNTGGAGGEWGEDAPKPSAPDVGALAEKEKAAAKAREEAAKAAARALEEQNKALADQAKLLAELSGLTGSFSKDWADLSAIYKRGEISLDQLTEAQAKLLAKQPAIKASIDAQKRAIEESSKMYNSAAIAARKYYEELANNSDKLEATNKKLAEENELIGLSEKAKEGLILSRLDNAIAIEQEAFALLNLQNSSEIEVATAQRRIDLMKEQRGLTASGIVAKEAKVAADEWKKTAESIRDSLTDAFMSAIDGTKSLWVSLRDSVVGMFKNMVLRPIIQGVVGAGVSAVAGSAAASAMGFGSSAAGAAAGASMPGGITSLLGSSSMGALDIMGFDPTTLAIGAALLVLSQMGGKFVSAADSGRASIDYTSAGIGGAAYNTTGDAAQIAAATANTNALAKTYFDTASALGVKAMQAAFEVGTNTGREGAAPQTVLGVNIGKASYSSGEIASGDAAALQLASSRAILTALQASDMPRYLAGVFDNITASTATQDQITAALTSAGALATFNKELLALPFANLAALSYSATQSLIKFSGGLDTLKSNLSTYYTNFYTAEEQRLQTIANINKATAGSGLDAATATRESFRKIVEAQDLSTESGQKMYAALISVSGAFAGLTPALSAVAATVTTTVDALQVAMARAQNANAVADSAMAALTASIDAEKSALSQKYESDLSALTTAQDAYTQSVTASISSISASVGSLQSLSNRLKSSLANPLAGTDGQQRQSAQALIASVLAIAKSGGGLPKDTTALESALSTVSKPSQALFGSFEDYARDFYKTSTDIAALSDITDTTLTAQQQMLAQLEAQSAISKAAYSSQAKLLKAQYDQAVKGLDTTLASAQKQLDALHGIDTSVLSVSAAIDRLAAALGAAKTTQATSNAVTDDTIRGYIANLKTGGGTEADMVITLAKRSKEVGVTQADIARAMGMTEVDVASYFASFGIPKFAQGTNYVPNDMVAMVHEGEAIIPKAYNPSAANTGNSDTAAALRALADRLDRIEANTRATAGHTAGTDRKLARVIPGNALITEAAV